MVRKKTIKLTPNEKRMKKEMISTFGGKENVDVSKIRKRILSLRKRKTNRTTARDMEDMFGY